MQKIVFQIIPKNYICPLNKTTIEGRKFSYMQT